MNSRRIPSFGASKWGYTVDWFHVIWNLLFMEALALSTSFSTCGFFVCHAEFSSPMFNSATVQRFAKALGGLSTISDRTYVVCNSRSSERKKATDGKRLLSTSTTSRHGV